MTERVTPERLAEIDDFILTLEGRTSIRSGPTPLKNALHDLRGHVIVIDAQRARLREALTGLLKAVNAYMEQHNEENYGEVALWCSAGRDALRGGEHD